MFRRAVMIVGVVLGVGAAVHAATVTYDVAFTGNTQRDITISPGQPVDISVTARVDPNPTTPDTDGFITVELDLDINFGLVQSAGFTLDPTFATVFSVFASGGSPFPNGGISDIRGVQNTFTPASVRRGMGLGTAMPVAFGTLDTPTTPGTYTIRTVGVGATILNPAPATTETIIPGNQIVNNSLTLRVSSGGGGGGGTPAAPTAQFSFTPNTGDPATIVFNAGASTGDALSYAWNFGDGQTGSNVTTSHKYANGTWTVVLTVTDSHAATATKSAQITLDVGGSTPAAPTAAFSFTPNAGDPTTVAFDASTSTGDGLSYSWSFGDGQSGTGQVTSHQFAVGTWTVTLVVTDSHGATANSMQSVAVSSAGGGTTPPPDGGSNPPPDNGNTNPPPSPVVAPMCGAGVTEMALFCTLGLFALQLTRRRY